MIKHARRTGHGRLAACVAAVFCGVLAFLGQAAAGPIGPGTDYMKTQPGSRWDFGNNAIAADFFGPGSDPFDGGVAIVCDTSVLRPEGTDFANNPDTVLTEIVALSLHSVEPIRVTYNGGMTESFFDVFVTLDGAAPPGANRGQYLVSRHSADGGMILGGVDSFFDVFFELQFTNQETGGVHVLQREDHVELTASVPWSHVAPPSYYHPGSGDFFPGVRDEELPESLIFQGSELRWDLGLTPIPEPSTVLLLCGGLLPLLRRRKRRGVTREA